MAIECYDDKCPYHSCNTEEDEGPFCYETECKFYPTKEDGQKKLKEALKEMEE